MQPGLIGQDAAPISDIFTGFGFFYFQAEAAPARVFVETNAQTNTFTSALRTGLDVQVYVQAGDDSLTFGVKTALRKAHNVL